jgi:hypothetical protein
VERYGAGLQRESDQVFLKELREGLIEGDDNECVLKYE